MFNSQILDVAIGLGMMYLFQSMLISGVNDLIVSVFSVRGKILKKFLMSALKTKEGGDQIFEKFSCSPFINNLKRNNQFPAEITSGNFSDSIIELIIREDSSEDTFIVKIRKNISFLHDSEFKSILIARLNESGDNYESFKRSIEKWYEDYMDRISRWYKKRITYFMYLFAFFTTVTLNIDSFYVMNELWRNKEMRESVVETAGRVVEKNNEYDVVTNDSIHVALEKVQDNYKHLHMLDFPITWEYAYHVGKEDGRCIADLSFAEKIEFTRRQLTLEKILGFIITTLAVSIGAPIWYDLIKKLVSARESLKSSRVNTN